MDNLPTDYPIESFSIKGLHGYKDVEIDFAGKATVIVAENGTGKTTVLNALNAFLSRRFHRLDAINFASIECKFRNSLLPITIAKSQLTARSDASIEALSSLAASASIAESDLVDFLANVYAPGNTERLRHHPVVRQLYVGTSHDLASLGRVLDDLHGSIDNTLTDAAKAASHEIRERMEGTEIVFLPTYRRIERPILRHTRPRGALRRPTPEKVEHDDMAFGLSDVQDRLAQLSEDIERRSNFEYRTLSARMLEDMLKSQGARENSDASQLPDIESLARFLSRVDRGSQASSVSLFARIKSLYESGRIQDADNWFLRYFLSRLSQVIDQTRETELVIEQFVTICNSYLTLSSDEKSLSFDPRTLRVIVQNTWANCQISLDDLSSGEKQIVSLMARLYLSPRPKLVLIDEPELSLSLDWQRKVLPDISSSPTVVQLLAITHSPFVFENELDRFARSLKITRSETVDVEPA